MAKNFRDNKKQFSTETIHLGTFLHPADDLLVLKLECKDIPYPNAPVLFNKKQIGKIDEVFGPVNDVYASVKLDGTMKPSSFRLESKFEAYKDKFIYKDRFLPREEVEKKKMQEDKKKSGSKQKDFKPRNDSSRFDNKRDFKRGNNDNQRKFGNNGPRRQGNDNFKRNDKNKRNFNKERK